jgi:hypothetical protein
VRTSPSREELYKDIAGQLSPQPSSRIVFDDLHSKFVVESADLAGEQRKMQQHVGVHNQEQKRPQHEEADQRQVHVEEGQPDRTLEEEVPVRYPARRYGEIEEYEEIAEPQARPDARGVDDCTAQGV